MIHDRCTIRLVWSNSVRGRLGIHRRSPQIRYIFDARDGGVLHGRYRNIPVGCGAIQWHKSHIYDMDEGGVKYGKRILSIFEDMTILRSCSYSTHTLVLR